MAKNNNGGVDAGVRKVKPKSAAQKAKAARNVEEAKRRLETIQPAHLPPGWDSQQGRLCRRSGSTPIVTVNCAPVSLW